MKTPIVALMLFLTHSVFGQKISGALGVFEQATDVGAVLHAGKTVYDPINQTYQLSGSGENIWFKKDEFHYAYKPLKGDFILHARGHLIGKGVDPHRKFGWMARSSLDTSSAMVSATVHGDGSAAIQYRKQAGMRIEEVKSPIKMPDVIQLERRGRSFIFSVANFGEPFWTVEVPDFDFPEELNAGLFICAHNKDIVEQATFDNVQIIVPAKPDFTPYRDYIGSHIELMEVATGHRRIIYSAPNSLQAPNWSTDGKYLLYNSEGLIYKLDLSTNTPQVLNTDFVKQNNNDHVISFDGKMLGLSSSSGDRAFGSMVYTVPIDGGVPKQVTLTGPSYLHGWSPNGKWLTYTAQRDNDYNIYKIKAKGGKEVRLTKSAGLDDGPEFSPDGKYIYFNSIRTGSMELWRMKTNGKGQEQLTDDRYQNWFAHIAPDNKSMVFISYPPEVRMEDHPFYKHVMLRTMPVGGGKPRVIAYIYGGQGTINTPSWSPDGKYIAFVSNSAME